MQIVDVSTGQGLTSALLECRSRMVMAFGGTIPETLLLSLLGDYVDNLYRTHSFAANMRLRHRLARLGGLVRGSGSVGGNARRQAEAEAGSTAIE